MVLSFKGLFLQVVPKKPFAGKDGKLINYQILQCMQTGSTGVLEISLPLEVKLPHKPMQEITVDVEKQQDGKLKFAKLVS